MKNKVSQILLALSIFVFGVLATLSLLESQNYLNFNPNSKDSSNTNCINEVKITDTGIADAVDKVYDAVVIVENYYNKEVKTTGTGFIYKIDDKYGYLITNYHVISGNTSVKIIMSDNTSVDANLLGGERYLDIAVLTIPKDKVKTVVKFGSSDNTRVGDTVFTVGTPVDYEYKGTVTRGILSGKNRLVSVALSSNNSDYVLNVLQTDAAINPGNSGGPLLNSNGEVIGVCSLKLVQSSIEGMAFALPIEYVNKNIEKIEKGEAIERPYIGITMLNISDAYNVYYNNFTIPNNITSGVVVASVLKNSPANGKLLAGDIITKINDANVSNIAYFRYELFKHSVGDTITITILRNNEEKDIKVTLIKTP